MTSLSIIIINYNVYDHLVNCLNSIQKNLTEKDYEIIIIDNNSTEDKDLKTLEVNYSNTKLIKLNKNLGFGAANNIAINNAKGKYLLFLNPDIILIDNSIYQMIDFLENHSEPGMVGPILLKKNLEIDYYYTFFPSILSIITFEYNLTKLNPIIKKRFYNFLKKNINLGKPFPVQQIMGACMLVKKSTINIIGDFDDKFFLYQEETDLQLRLMKNKFKCYILPTAKVIHNESSSINKVGLNFRRMHWIRSTALYVNKNFNFIERIITRYLLSFGIILKYWKSLLIKNNFKNKEIASKYNWLLLKFIFISPDIPHQKEFLLHLEKRN